VTPAETQEAIRAALIAKSEPWKLPVMQRFFKEPIDAYCTYTEHVRNIAKEHGAEFASWPEKERTALTKALWESGKFEEGTMAIQLYARMRRKCEYREWKIFSRWLDKHIRNWAHCDALCGDVLGLMLIAHPEWIGEMKAWAGSKEKYKRRAALVAPLKGIRNGLFLAEADTLLALLAADREDIVKKGLVWMRKELAR
jgi:3-methyladenine DNA glycosylase AlkD